MRRSCVEWHVDQVNSMGDLVFSGRVSMADVADLRLDSFDQMILAAPIESAADLFQNLHLIYFRMQQQAEMAAKVEIQTLPALE